MYIPNEENGELEAAFGEGFFVVYFLTRGEKVARIETQAHRRESTLGGCVTLVLYGVQ